MHALLRLAGRSALAAGLVHLLQFLVLGIGPALREPDHPTPAESAAGYWFGVVGMVTFTLIALCYLAFFHAATTLVWRGDGPTAPAWRRAAQSAATIGIGCWLTAGATGLARRGFNAAGIAAAAESDPVARAALQATYVGFSAVAVAGAVAFCAWWVGFAVRGVRAGVIGWPTAVVVALLGGLVPLAGWLANLGGVPSVVLAFLVLGPVLLVRARRAGRPAPGGDAARAAAPSGVAQ